MATSLSQDALLLFLQGRGGAVKNSDLLLHFRVFLREHENQARHRELFKSYVNALATVRQQDGVSYVVLRKKLRGQTPAVGHSSGSRAEPAALRPELSPGTVSRNPGRPPWQSRGPREKPAEQHILPAAGLLNNNPEKQLSQQGASPGARGAVVAVAAGQQLRKPPMQQGATRAARHRMSYKCAVSHDDDNAEDEDDAEDEAGGLWPRSAALGPLGGAAPPPLSALGPLGGAASPPPSALGPLGGAASPPLSALGPLGGAASPPLSALGPLGGAASPPPSALGPLGGAASPPLSALGPLGGADPPPPSALGPLGGAVSHPPPPQQVPGGTLPMRGSRGNQDPAGASALVGGPRLPPPPAPHPPLYLSPPPPDHSSCAPPPPFAPAGPVGLRPLQGPGAGLSSSTSSLYWPGAPPAGLEGNSSQQELITGEPASQLRSLTAWCRSTGDLLDNQGTAPCLLYSTGGLHDDCKRADSSGNCASPALPRQRPSGAQLRARKCRSLGAHLDGEGRGEEGRGRQERLLLLSSSSCLRHAPSTSSLSSCASPCASPRWRSLQELQEEEGPGGRGPSAHALHDNQSSVPLGELEHAWLVKGAMGSWPDVYALFREDSSLLHRRDFISGFTMLHWVAKHGDHRVLNTLWYGVSRAGLSLGVDARSALGHTPLHLAAMHGHRKMLRLLVLKFQADVSARDAAGKRPWHYLPPPHSPDLLQLLGAPGGRTGGGGGRTTAGGDEGDGGERSARTPKVKRSTSLAAFLKHKTMLRAHPL